MVMLGPDEQFTVLSLSGDKPKRPNVIKTICLLLGPDFCTDIITIETADHARLQLQLSYNWYVVCVCSKALYEMSWGVKNEVQIDYIIKLNTAVTSLSFCLYQALWHQTACWCSPGCGSVLSARLCGRRVQGHCFQNQRSGCLSAVWRLPQGIWHTWYFEIILSYRFRAMVCGREYNCGRDNHI